jgi:hypothetical protein
MGKKEARGLESVPKVYRLWTDFGNIKIFSVYSVLCLALSCAGVKLCWVRV